MEGQISSKHPEALIALNYLSLILYANGHFKEGLLKHKKCAAIQRAKFGKTYPNYLVTLNNISVFYLCIGEYQKSIKIYKTNEIMRRASKLSQIMLKLR